MIQDDQLITRRDIALAIEPLATKEQLERLVMDHIKLRESVATKDDLKLVQADVRRLTQTVDSFISDLTIYARESIGIPAALDKQGAQILNHEKRISALESKP